MQYKSFAFIIFHGLYPCGLQMYARRLLVEVFFHFPKGSVAAWPRTLLHAVTPLPRAPKPSCAGQTLAPAHPWAPAPRLSCPLLLGPLLAMTRVFLLPWQSAGLLQSFAYMVSTTDI